MTALRIVVTRAGRAALLNAAADGTNAVRIGSCGVTAQAFTPTADLTALPGEVKRITSIAGDSTSDVTIHVTVRDDSADAYTVRGLGFYLDDGITLFATYSQATPILEKTPLSIMLLASDTVFADIDATQVVFGDTTFILPSATTDQVGQVELATSDETIAGLDDLRAVSPKALLATLNERFGAGAPSKFVKGLLTSVTDAALRLAIGLGRAATFDTGPNSGLDADTVDGKHASDLANASHTHAIGEVTGLPDALALKAPLASPALAGTPTAPTPAADDNGTRVATTGFVQGLINALSNSVTQLLSGKSNVGHHHPFAEIDSLTEYLADRPTNATLAATVASLQGFIALKMSTADMVFSVNGETGYVQFPPGADGRRLMYQFGVYRPGAPWVEGTGPTINFPAAFPNAITGLTLSDINNNLGAHGYNHYDIYAQETLRNQTGFTTFLQWPGSSDANYWAGLFYEAWGY